MPRTAGPEPLPHPEHILNTRLGTAEIVEPLTKKEKGADDKSSERKKALIEDIVEYHNDLAAELDEKVRAIMRDEIARMKYLLDMLHKVFPGLWSYPLV